MPVAWQPSPEVESLQLISLIYMANRISYSTAGDLHGWIFAEVVYGWRRIVIPWYTGITVFLEMVYYRRAFLNTTHPCLWNLVPNYELGRFFCLFCHGMSMFASVVTLVGRTAVTSLSHWVSTFVYHAVYVTYNVAWFVFDRWDLPRVNLSLHSSQSEALGFVVWSRLFYAGCPPVAQPVESKQSTEEKICC